MSIQREMVEQTATHQTDYNGKNVSSDVEWFLEYILLSDTSEVQNIIYYIFPFMEKERKTRIYVSHCTKYKQNFKPETGENGYL